MASACRCPSSWGTIKARCWLPSGERGAIGVMGVVVACVVSAVCIMSSFSCVLVGITRCRSCRIFRSIDRCNAEDMWPIDLNDHGRIDIGVHHVGVGTLCVRDIRSVGIFAQVGHIDRHICVWKRGVASHPVGTTHLRVAFLCPPNVSSVVSFYGGGEQGLGISGATLLRRICSAAELDFVLRWCIGTCLKRECCSGKAGMRCAKEKTYKDDYGQQQDRNPERNC